MMHRAWDPHSDGDKDGVVAALFRRGNHARRLFTSIVKTLSGAVEKDRLYFIFTSYHPN